MSNAYRPDIHINVRWAVCGAGHRYCYVRAAFFRCSFVSSSASVSCRVLTGVGVICRPSLYWFGGLLYILSNLAYGAAFVFYNAYLPILVRSHPK